MVVERPKLIIKDIDEVLDYVRGRIINHFATYGNGIFLHPHEIVGCMFGQQMKLSTAADATLYDEDLSAFKERCYKTLLAMVMASASVNKLEKE